jgi:MFS family permease
LTPVPRILVDLSPLRESAAFRRLWSGYVVNQVGTQLTVVAIAYQVFRITGSSLDVGLISLAQVIPGFVAPLAAGALGDTFDRRRLLFITNAGGLLCSLGLAADAQLHLRTLWPLFFFAAGSACFSGADNPIRTALLITVVERRLITSANVLRTLLQQTATVVGPTAAGLLLQFGLSPVYWVDVASYAFVLAMLARVRSPPDRDSVQPAQDGGLSFAATLVATFLDGIRYARTSQAILGCLVADLSVNFLAMPESLFPAIALHHLHGGARTVGLLYAAPGVGALMMALFSGWTRGVRRCGLAIVLAIGVWGAVLALFGLADSLAPALLLLAMAGAANAVSGVFRNTIGQTEAPDNFRARLASIHSAGVLAGPRLGNAESGVLGSVVSPEAAVVIGGIGAIVATGLIALRMPRFLRYSLPPRGDENAPDVQEAVAEA